MGAKPAEAANRNAMANPRAPDALAEYARTQQDYGLGRDRADALDAWETPLSPGRPA